MEAISDDYYNEINLKFLIAEYERAKLDKQSCLQFLIETKTNPTFADDRPVYSKFVKIMMIKESNRNQLESKITKQKQNEISVELIKCQNQITINQTKSTFDKFHRFDFQTFS